MIGKKLQHYTPVPASNMSFLTSKCTNKQKAGTSACKWGEAKRSK